MKKSKKRLISPACDLNVPLLSKIAYKCWPKDKFNLIEGVNECKQFYNTCYNHFHDNASSVYYILGGLALTVYFSF